MSRHKWTKADDRWIKKHTGIMTKAEMAAHLGVTPQALYVHASRQNVASKKQYHVWTEDEVVTLRELYGTMSLRKIAERMGMEYGSVRQKSQRMGLTAYRSQCYTEEELSFIRRNCGSMPIVEIAERLGRSRHSVNNRVSRMGLESYHTLQAEYRKEIYADVLTMVCAGKSNREIADRYCLTLRQVRNYLVHFDIRRSRFAEI